MDGQVGGGGVAAGGQLLEDQGGGEARQAEAAVRLVDVQAKVVLLGGPASRRQWKVTFAVPGGGIRCPFAAGKGLGTVDSKRCSSVSSKFIGITCVYRCCAPLPRGWASALLAG